MLARRVPELLQKVPIQAKYVNMTDINSSSAATPSRGVSRQRRRGEPQSVSRDDLVAMVELLFFAYRDFTAGPDAILAEIGFGRAHHRVLHFVNRNPGLRVADLLGVLKITKQSLARVLKQLVDEGYVVQARPDSDRRERRLHLTDKGRLLADRLLDMQAQRIADALAEAGSDARQQAQSFLFAVIGREDQPEVRRLIEGPAERVKSQGDGP